MEFKEFYNNLTQEDWMKIIDSATEAQLELLRKAREILEFVNDKEDTYD